ncbi:phosphatidylinositol-specific phospholipase C1-like protein [soil metagenome]
MPGRWRTAASVVAVVTATAVAGAMAGAGAQESGPDREPVAGLPGDDVRLNEIQVVGTHNSYRVEPPEEEKRIMRSVDPAGAETLEYGHRLLGDQFAGQKVRQIELDIFADPEGGKYANPLIRTFAGLPPYDQPAMDEPGMKVLHIQDIDYHTTCLTLVACLQAVKAWSDANAGHLPLAILIEAKDDPILPESGIEFVEPVPFDTAQYDAVDAEIRSVFSEGELLTPDDVRGDAATLEEAVLTDGWPTLGESRDQVVFFMDQGGTDREAYLAGHPNLEGRVMFTNAEPGQPDAAFVKVNDPLGAGGERIPQLVVEGYLVRSRADEPTFQARSGDTTMRDAALASGAQFVSTDYPVPGLTERFGTDYFVEIPGGTVARCNPVNAPPGCVDSELEHIPVVPLDPPAPPAGAPPGSSGGSAGIPAARPAQPVTAQPRFTG